MTSGPGTGAKITSEPNFSEHAGIAKTHKNKGISADFGVEPGFDKLETKPNRAPGPRGAGATPSPSPGVRGRLRSRSPPADGGGGTSCASGGKSDLQEGPAQGERKIPPEGCPPTRSRVTELASSESSSLESRLQAARSNAIFGLVQMRVARVAGVGYRRSTPRAEALRRGLARCASSTPATHSFVTSHRLILNHARFFMFIRMPENRPRPDATRQRC